MTVRDLGYRAYEGERLPSTHNTWVLLRYGLWRGWGSWIIKLAVIFSPVVALVMAALVGGAFFLSGGEMPMEGGRLLSVYFNLQVWLFLTVITLRSGAGVIAEDFTFRAFQFYFAKPVTRVQYLLGRTLALVILTFSVLFVPALLIVAALAGTASEDHLGENIGLLLPTFLFSLIASLAVSTLSIAMSALSKSRALTMSAWMMVFFVPHVLALLVDNIADWPWLYLGSIPGLLSVLRDALFKVTAEESKLEWFYAAPMLAALVGSGIYYAMHRLRSAEVIT